MLGERRFLKIGDFLFRYRDGNLSLGRRRRLPVGEGLREAGRRKEGGRRHGDGGELNVGPLGCVVFRKCVENIFLANVTTYPSPLVYNLIQYTSIHFCFQFFKNEIHLFEVYHSLYLFRPLLSWKISVKAVTNIVIYKLSGEHIRKRWPGANVIKLFKAVS